MNENKKVVSGRLLKHIWASIREDRDVMISAHRLYIALSEEYGICFPNEYIKLAKTQYILISERRFQLSKYHGNLFFKSNTIYISFLILQKNLYLRKLN